MVDYLAALTGSKGTPLQQAMYQSSQVQSGEQASYTPIDWQTGWQEPAKDLTVVLPPPDMQAAQSQIEASQAKLAVVESKASASVENINSLQAQLAERGIIIRTSTGFEVNQNAPVASMAYGQRLLREYNEAIEESKPLVMAYVLQARELNKRIEAYNAGVEIQKRLQKPQAAIEAEQRPFGLESRQAKASFERAQPAERKELAGLESRQSFGEGPLKLKPSELNRMETLKQKLVSFDQYGSREKVGYLASQGPVGLVLAGAEATGAGYGILFKQLPETQGPLLPKQATPIISGARSLFGLPTAEQYVLGTGSKAELEKKGQMVGETLFWYGVSSPEVYLGGYSLLAKGSKGLKSMGQIGAIGGGRKKLPPVTTPLKINESLLGTVERVTTNEAFILLEGKGKIPELGKFVELPRSLQYEEKVFLESLRKKPVGNAISKTIKQSKGLGTPTATELTLLKGKGKFSELGKFVDVGRQLQYEELQLAKTIGKKSTVPLGNLFKEETGKIVALSSKKQLGYDEFAREVTNILKPAPKVERESGYFATQTVSGREAKAIGDFYGELRAAERARYGELRAAERARVPGSYASLATDLKRVSKTPTEQLFFSEMKTIYGTPKKLIDATLARTGIPELDAFAKQEQKKDLFSEYGKQTSGFADFTKGTGPKLENYTETGRTFGNYTENAGAYVSGMKGEFEKLRIEQGFESIQTSQQPTKQDVKSKQIGAISLKQIQLNSVSFGQAINLSQTKGITQAKAVSQTKGITQAKAVSQFEKQAQSQSQVISLARIQTINLTQTRGITKMNTIGSISLLKTPELLKTQPPKPRLFRLPPFTKKPLQPALSFGYKVLVRQTGKKTPKGFEQGAFSPLTKGILTKEAALSLGQAITAGTEKRSFKIVPAFGLPEQAKRLPAFRPEMFYKKGRTYIEKTKFALSEPGEQATITQKGLLTLKMQPELRKKKNKRLPSLLGNMPFKKNLLLT